MLNTCTEINTFLVFQTRKETIFMNLMHVKKVVLHLNNIACLFKIKTDIRRKSVCGERSLRYCGQYNVT
jgi:hypothetical protein